jgi:hypothetical protein
MGKNILFVLLGAFLMYLVLKIISSKALSGSGTSVAAINVLKTQQAANLIMTNEFRELARTPQFKYLLKTLAANEINAMTNAMAQRTF